MTRLLLRAIPPRRLAWAVAIAGVLWVLPGRVGFYAGMAGLIAVALFAVVDWVLLPGKRGVVVERELPNVVGIGDRASGTYTIRSAWPRRLRLELVDEMPSAIR